MTTPSQGSKSRRRASSPSPRILELSKPVNRVEYLDTPGAYYWDESKLNRKIPYVFRTSTRFTPDPPPLSDTLRTDRASAVDPMVHAAVISDAPRWKPEKPAPARQYNVEPGLKLIEPRTFAATFATQDRPEPKAAPSHMPDQDYLTIGHTHHHGGKFSQARRDTLEHFLIRSPSPGPIYRPNLQSVEGKAQVTVFSSQIRVPSPPSTGPGPLAYADAVEQVDRLSQHRRSPSVRIGDVPSSSSMPFPYTMVNFCNSRSMRTAFCKTYAAIRRPTPSESRPATAGSSQAVRDLSDRRRERVSSALHNKRQQQSSFEPWKSPFSAAGPSNTVMSRTTVMTPFVAETAIGVEFHETAAPVPSLLARHQTVRKAASAAAPSPSPPLSRFAFARKFPQLTASVDHRADGAMRDIIAEARKTHPQPGLKLLRSVTNSPPPKWIASSSSSQRTQ